MKAAIFVIVLATFTTSLVTSRPDSSDYDCSDNYGGKCYNCHYSLDANRFCFRSSVCVLYKNGFIYTANKLEDWPITPAKSMIIKNGKVEFLGPKATDGDAKAKEMKCRIIDLDGKAVLPGLHDVHMHPMEVGSSVAGTCMVPKNTKPNDAKMFVNFEAGCFLNQTGTDWILGHGHSIWAMLDYIKYPGPGGLLDPKKWLDLYVSDKPVVIMEETSHSVWVNTEALKRAGLLGKNPQAPIGGKVMLNADNEANGILIENAGNWIMDMAFNQVLYPKLIPLADEGLVAGLDELAKNGITSFVDARCYWQRENHKSYERVEFGNKMTARAVLAMWAYPAATNDDAQIEALANFYNNPMDGMVKRTQIKVYEDGLFGVRTARVLKPYLLPTPDYGIGDFGLNYFTQQRLGEYINALQIGLGQDGTEGYDFMVHVVGDAATREVLDAVRDNPHPIEGASRHRCTHVELVDESDRPRFKALNVIADAQVAGDFALSGSPAHKDMVKMVGPRGEDSIPIKSLKAQGARVTLSSDWDVSPLSPFLGMSHAINRGPQSVSLKEAVEMYTIEAAYVMRQEGITGTGSLVVGKQADLIVIDQDIFNPIKGIEVTKVLQTVVGGEEVYSTLPMPKI